MNRPLRLRREEREEGKYCGRRVNAAHNALHPFRLTRAMENQHIAGGVHKTQSFGCQLKVSELNSMPEGQVSFLEQLHTAQGKKNIPLRSLRLSGSNLVAVSLP